MKTYTSKDVVKHPFELIFAEGSPRFLVIGSFPTTDRNMAFNFFYPNPRNKFWKVINEVFPKNKTSLNLKVSIKDTIEIRLQNEKERKRFCKENEIAMTDMFASCVRLAGNSKDEQLLLDKYCPILDILKQYKNINRIILTGKSSGASAHHHFYQYLVMNKVDFAFNSSKEISTGEIKVDGRIINIFSMDSTSSRNSHVTENELVRLYKQAFHQ